MRKLLRASCLLLVACNHGASPPPQPPHDLDTPGKPDAAPAPATPPTPPTPPATTEVVLADHRVAPHDLAITPTALYWLEGNNDGSDVMTLRLGASGAKPTSIVHVKSALHALAVGDKDLLYLTPEALMLVDLDGTHPHIVDRQAFGRMRIALDGDAFYVANGGGEVVRYERISATLYPPAKRKLVENVEYSFQDQIALTADSVVFSNELDDTPRRIVRVAKRATAAAPEDVRVDDTDGVVDWTATADTIFYLDKQSRAWKIAATAADAAKDRVSIPKFPAPRYAIRGDDDDGAIIDRGPPR